MRLPRYLLHSVCNGHQGSPGPLGDEEDSRVESPRLTKTAPERRGGVCPAEQRSEILVVA